jgi:hypothetical protein
MFQGDSPTPNTGFLDNISAMAVSGHQEIYGGDEGLRHHLCVSHGEHLDEGASREHMEDLHEDEHGYNPGHRGEYGCFEHDPSEEPTEFHDMHEGGGIGEIHRGIGVSLPDRVHRVVHDESRPAHERAQALLSHVSDHPGHLGMHWTTENHVAEDFAERSAQHEASEDQRGRSALDDFTWGHEQRYKDTPLGKPGTAVIFHAHEPSLDAIESDGHRLSNGGAYGWSEHGEREVPIRDTQSLDLKGISWAPMHSDDEVPGHGEYTHHEFGHEHTASAQAQRMSVEDLLGLHSNEALRRKQHFSGDRYAGHGDDTRVSTVYDRKAAEMGKNPGAWGELDEPIRNGSIDPVLLETSSGGHTVVSEGQHRIVRAHQLGVTHLPVSYDPGSQEHRYDWDEPEPLDEHTAARDDEDYDHSVPPAERTESVRHMLDHYKPYDFPTWKEVSDNSYWHHPVMRAFVDHIRQHGVQRPIPVDYEQDPPMVRNGHTRLLAAERAGRTHVPTRQWQWMDPDEEPDLPHLLEGHESKEAARSGDEPSSDYKDHQVVAHFEDERPFGYYTLRHRTEDLGERKPRHFIDAHTPEGAVAGRMNWFGTTGLVHHIDVAGEEDDAANGSSSIGDGRDHQGRGLATAMWDWSQEMRPKAKHSRDQTNQGKAWARGLKNRERREAPEGPPPGQVTAVVAHFEAEGISAEASGTDDYGMSHRPLAAGAPAHDLTHEGGWPADVYTHPQYYGGDAKPSEGEREGLEQLRAARGKPDQPVTIYRASPPGAPYRMHTGDWVSLSPAYAAQHAWQHEEDDPAGKWHVHKAVVPASHVRDAATMPYTEQGYWGPDIDSEHHAGPRREITREAAGGASGEAGRPYYHASYEDFEPGDTVSGGHRLDDLYLADSIPGAHKYYPSGHVYEVEPHGEPQPSMEHEYTVPSGTVTRRVPSEEVSGAVRDAYNAPDEKAVRDRRNRVQKEHVWRVKNDRWYHSYDGTDKPGWDEYAAHWFPQGAENATAEQQEASRHGHPLPPDVHRWIHGVEAAAPVLDHSELRPEHFVDPSVGRREAVGPDYQGVHVPPGGPDDDPEWAAPMHDVRNALPLAYEHPEYYPGGDAESVRQLRAAEGKPDHPVTVYRALPHGQASVNRGDWVSTSASYARRHGESNLSPHTPWHVVRATVPAKHLFNEGYHTEWGYQGPDVQAERHAGPFSQHEVVAHFEAEGEGSSEIAVEHQERPSGGATYPHMHVLTATHPDGTTAELRYMLSKRNGKGIVDHAFLPKGYAESLGKPLVQEARRLHPGTFVKGLPGIDEDWGQHLPSVTSLHRNLTVKLEPADRDFVHDESVPRVKRAGFLMDLMARGGPSMHWASQRGRAAAEQSFGDHEFRSPDHTQVAINAAPPSPEHVETDPERISRNGGYAYQAPDWEVPLKEGAPVTVNSVRWRTGNTGWTHHQFKGGHQFTAGSGSRERTAAVVEEGDRLPPDPGTAPVPEGHVRLWHYTPLENVPSIREHGLQRSYARGDAGDHDLSDPSAGVWASTKRPDDILNNHSGGAAVVEFHAHPEEISGHAESPWHAMNKDRTWDQDKVREWGEGYHHVIMRGDVHPSQIAAIHEPWHGSARYMRDDPHGPESYQWVKDETDPAFDPYKRGLRALEHGHLKEAAVTKEPDDSSRRFFHGSTGTYSFQPGDLLTPGDGRMRHVYYTSHLPSAARYATYGQPQFEPGHPEYGRGYLDLNAEARPGHVYEVQPETKDGKKIGRHAEDPDSGLPGNEQAYRTKGRLRVLHEVDRETGEPFSEHREPSLGKEASVSIASRFQPGMRNPHTGGDDWFHGTQSRPEDLQEGFHVPTSHDHYDEEMRGHLSHWNTFLGTHFAAAHSMADHFGRVGASNADDEDGEYREPYSRYEERSPANVVHARLHLHNPKHYASEHDMDNEAYEHEAKAGNWISKHFDGYEHEDPSHPDYDPQSPGDDEEWPLAAKFRHDSRQPLIGPDEHPVGYGGIFSNDHPGQRRRAEWLGSHPDKAGIGARFRQRLIDQGHDGITYGNELEIDHGGGGEHGALSAIAFHPHQAEITQHHDVERPCLSHEEAEHQRSRMPQPGQEELPGVEEHADRFPNGFLRGAALVAHFEEPRTAAPVYMQQKLFHAQPDPTRHAPESGLHNPADPDAHMRWREENEEGYRRPLEDPERGNWDDDAGAWHHPDKGWHCHVCDDFHDSAGTVEEHDGSHTDWDEVHPQLPGTMHRGLRLADDGSYGWSPHHYRDSANHEDAARAILGHLGELGTHWTPTEGQARHYAGIGDGHHGPEGHDMHVVVHARKPERDDIETDPDTLAGQGVLGFDKHEDAEIPLREGAPVDVTGVSWKFHDEPDSAWRRHDLGNGNEHVAAIDPGRKNLADIGSSMLAYDKDLSPDDHAFISAAIDHIRRGAPPGEPIDAGDAEHMARGMRTRDRMEQAGWKLAPGQDKIRYPRGFTVNVGDQHRATLSPNTPSGWHVRTHPADYGSAAGHVHHDLDVPDEELPSALGKYYASPQIRGELAAQQGEVIAEGRHEGALSVVAHFEEGPLPAYHGEPLYHGTRSILEPGEHLTVDEAGRHPNNADIQTDPYVHATTDPREAHHWGERANAYQAQHRMTELGRERRIGPGENAAHAYRPRVYHVEPTGHVEPDLEYADTEHDSWRSASPMRVKREVRALTCYDCPDTGQTEEHWPDHPHHEYLQRQEDEDEADREERGHRAVLTGGPDQVSDREQRSDRWHEFQNRYNDDLHRGIHVELPDHLHDYVHDESVPREERAEALQGHFADLGEGLGMHWTPDPQIAQRAIWNAADAGHGLSGGRLYRGEPEVKTTDVMFHVRKPGERNRLRNPQQLQEHEVGHQFSHDEDEFPLKPGTPLRLSGISWKQHDPGHPMEAYEHHDFERPMRHVSSVTALPAVVAHFGDQHAAPPQAGEEMWRHLQEGHGVSGAKTPAAAFMNILHGRFHNGRTPDPRRVPHQHEGQGDPPPGAQSASDSISRMFTPVPAEELEEQRRAREPKPERLDDREYSVNDVSRHYDWEGFSSHEIAHLVHHPERAVFTKEDVPVKSLRHEDEHGRLVAPPSYHDIAGQGDDERERLEELEHGYEQGAPVPPIVVVRHGEHHVIADGSHRAAVHAERGSTHIPAFVTQRTIFPEEHTAAVTAAYDWNADEGPYTWDEIAQRHPRVYGDDEDHEPGMGEGGGHNIADAAAELYHDRPGHPYSESEGELHPENSDEMQFHPRTVDVNRIDYMRVDRDEHDPRVERAKKGFQDHRQREKIPPLILVHRHGVYQVADGSHRGNGAEQAHWPSVRAYVAYSPHEDEPFAGRDGEPPQRGPFHGAETRDRPPMLDGNGGLARRISFPGFPHTTERPRPQAHEGALVAHFEEPRPVTLEPVHDVVLAAQGPLSPAVEAARALGSWEPEDGEELLRAVCDFPEVFTALRDGLLRLSRVTEDMPVHPEVADMICDMARSLLTASDDAAALLRTLPPEASWQEPGPPNR